MRPVSVSEYDSNEKAGIADTPTLIIQAMYPCTFAAGGYPFRVDSEKELYKYIDVMHETLYSARFEKLLNGITSEEFDILKAVATSVVDFCNQNYDRKIAPRGALVQSLNVLRHIKFVYGNHKAKVFEYGPGCGYLGALLNNEGYPYAAMDIAQALYLFQNHMWSHLSGHKVLDGVNTPNALEALYNINGDQIIHIPWWDYYKMDVNNAPRFDVVTINHAICEMHNNALKLALLHIRSMLRGDVNEKKLLMFEGWGQSNSSRREFVNTQLYQHGFRMVHHDLKITAFALEGTELANNCAQFPQFYEVNQPVLSGNGQIQITRSSHPTWVPAFYSSEHNSFSRSIMNSRQSLQSSQNIAISEVDQFYSNLLGKTDHRTEDEKFMALIGLQSIVCDENGNYL